MNYPRQLISSLVAQTDKRLKDFFKLESRKYFTSSDFNTIIDETLWLYIKDETEKSEIKAIYNTQTRMRRQKKGRWVDAFHNNLDNCTETDHKHPFYTINRHFEELPGQNFLKIYDQLDLDAVKEDYEKKILAWKQDENELLINYPLISDKTKKQIISSFQTDLIINLLDIILVSFEGNIESYFSKKPDVLLSVPIFSANKFTIPLQESFSSYVAELFSSDAEDIGVRAIINYDADNPPKGDVFKVFDHKDNQIILTLIKNIKPDFYDSKAVLIDIGSIAKVFNPRPSGKNYEDVRERLFRMVWVSFAFYRKSTPEKTIFAFNFLDNVLIKEQNGREYVDVTFGNVLYNAVIQKKMIAVTSSSFNSLDLELSKLLYHNFQKERIILSYSSAPDQNGYLYKSYDYSFFKRIVLFKKKKKSDNVALLKETLNEFVEKKIAIASYTFDPNQSRFHLYYFQLTSDEKEDLTDEHYSMESFLETSDMIEAHSDNS